MSCEISLKSAEASSALLAGFVPPSMTISVGSAPRSVIARWRACAKRHGAQRHRRHYLAGRLTRAHAEGSAIAIEVDLRRLCRGGAVNRGSTSRRLRASSSEGGRGTRIRTGCARSTLPAPYRPGMQRPHFPCE
jgi:hypothetical protein